MTETETEKPKKRKGPLSLARPGKLELNKTVDGGQVRQSFSHGRSKVVAVEVRKKRTYTTDRDGHLVKVASGQIAEAPEPIEETQADAGRGARTRTLTREEMEVRARALQDSRRVEEEEGHRRREVEEEQALLGPHGEPDTAAESAESELEAVAEPAEMAEAAPAAEEPVAPAAEETESAPPAAEADVGPVPESGAEGDDKPQKPAAPRQKAKKEEGGEGEEDDTEARERSKRGGAPARPDQAKRAVPGGKKSQGQRRRGGKLTIAEALGADEERTRSLASVRRAREREKQKHRQQLSEGKKVIRDVIIPETLTVQELANRMAERASDVIKTLMKMGVMATITQTIDADTAELVVAEFGHNFKRVSESDVEDGLTGGVDSADSRKPRPPVVTVMGHVDHGKTSLLDAIREADVVSGEAGGITQHIGAYQVSLGSGRKITFIDTPGHAAFTEMRARGAKVTDIVVLVVAADDGVMPQTIEAIHHAKAAGVPIVVAINKIDKPDARPERVRNELLQHEVLLEDVGGDVLSVEVSAKEKLNLDKLEEIILLQAEMLDLTANPDRPGEGVVVEAKMERGRGVVATVLVQRGTLRVGDIFVAGNEWGRVRALVDDRGNPIEAAGPGMPVEVLGLNGTPAAGDDMVVADNEQRAREVSEFRQRKARDVRTAASARGTLEQMFSRIQEGEASALPVVVKADVHGSQEAILSAVDKLATDEVKVQVLHAAVGGINESDVTLARASNALVIGFNVRANPQARDLAKRDGVEIRYYSIIYDVTDDLKKMLSGMLSPDLKEEILGYADVREVFNITKVGKVAGCMVTEGVVKRGAKVRLLRDDVVIHEGALSQLKRFKDDAKEVREGYDCGMSFANYHDIQVGDRIECFEVEEVAREL